MRGIPIRSPEACRRETSFLESERKKVVTIDCSLSPHLSQCGMVWSWGPLFSFLRPSRGRDWGTGPSFGSGSPCRGSFVWKRNGVRGRPEGQGAGSQVRRKDAGLSCVCLMERRTRVLSWVLIVVAGHDRSRMTLFFHLPTACGPASLPLFPLPHYLLSYPLPSWAFSGLPG